MQPGQRHESDQPGRPLARGRLAVGAQSRPARGGDPRCGRHAAPSTADHRRCGHRQDQDPGPSGRGPARPRRRAGLADASDLLAPRGRRDEAPHRSPAGESSRRGAARCHAALVGHISRRRRAVAARVRRLHRHRSGVHDPRSRGFRRPDQSRPSRAGAVRAPATLSPEGHLSGDLFVRRQYLPGTRRRPAAELSVVPRMGGRTAPAVPRLRRSEAGPAGTRLRRSAALLGAHARRPRTGRRTR